MKTFLLRSLIGIFFGGFLTTAITCLIVLGGAEMLDSGIFLKNAIATTFCGWFFSITPLYFENENWSLLRQTIYHFLTVVLLYFTTAYWIGWYDITWKSSLTFIGIFLLVYAAIWTAFYLYHSNEAKKLNEGLRG